MSSEVPSTSPSHAPGAGVDPAEQIMVPAALGRNMLVPSPEIVTSRPAGAQDRVLTARRPSSTTPESSAPAGHAEVSLRALGGGALQRAVTRLGEAAEAVSNEDRTDSESEGALPAATDGSGSSVPREEAPAESPGDAGGAAPPAPPRQPPTPGGPPADGEEPPEEPAEPTGPSEPTESTADAPGEAARSPEPIERDNTIPVDVLSTRFVELASDDELAAMQAEIADAWETPGETMVEETESVLYAFETDTDTLPKGARPIITVNATTETAEPDDRPGELVNTSRIDVTVAASGHEVLEAFLGSGEYPVVRSVDGAVTNFGMDPNYFGEIWERIVEQAPPEVGDWLMDVQELAFSPEAYNEAVRYDAVRLAIRTAPAGHGIVPTRDIRTTNTLRLANGDSLLLQKTVHGPALEGDEVQRGEFLRVVASVGARKYVYAQVDGAPGQIRVDLTSPREIGPARNEEWMPIDLGSSQQKYPSPDPSHQANRPSSMVAGRFTDIVRDLVRRYRAEQPPAPTDEA